MHTVSRYHDLSVGHRVVNHESKCRYLHGHNYRVHFECISSDLDSIGRVIDFSEIKARLCFWLEDHWDHKTLLWKEDPILDAMLADIPDSIVVVPFNPTAENMAAYLVDTIGPKMLEGTGIVLKRVVVEETRKCRASYEAD